MVTKEEKFLALKESVLIYRDLQNNVTKEKEEVIDCLWRKGKLAFSKYLNSCPLCDLYQNDCSQCIWPLMVDVGNQPIKPKHKCCHPDSPFKQWQEADHPTFKYRAAVKVEQF